MSEYPVVIIGAGPTGMAAAALLAEHGVRSIVFEREADVVAIPRAVHLDEEVLRVLHRTCLGAEVAPEIRPIRGMLLVDRDRRTLVSFARDGLGPHGFARSNAFDQPELERAMRRAIEREPLVTLRTATTVEAIEHRADGRLRVTFHDKRRDALDAIEAPAVLACDGARSRTRMFVGTDFEDLGFDARWLVVDVVTDAPLGLYDGCLQVADRDRPTTYFCTGGGRHRWEIMLRDHETAAEMTCEPRVRELLAPWLGAEVSKATLRRRAVYTFHSLVARRFRRGNVFLLGDAAHQTPPFIGQGMGAGVRDAANLAWKLAAVLDGRAHPELLDTYESERRPHVRSVIAQAVLLGKTMRTPIGGRYRDRMIAALGPRFHDLLVRRAFPDLTPGPMVRPRGSGPAGGHVPRAVIELSGRTTHLDEALGHDFALLALDADRERVRVRRFGDSEVHRTVIDREGTLRAWFEDLGAEAALVRPDRVVMASGAATSAPRWIEALSRACGWRAPKRPPAEAAPIHA
ncbi:MAG: bifunctional 3-(3-hydroxy-phenyl)propionate/3-hydroxycinnamic acid hydroxylase [Polyangiaceae bacterium]